MNKEIIINVSTNLTRIAITEDGLLTEYFGEHEESKKSVGDIYLGRIAKVIPGIKAAFIDVGQKQDAFLHFSDIGDQFDEYNSLIDDEDSDVETSEEDEEDENGESAGTSQNGSAQSEEFQFPKLERGKDILVQVTKEPIGNKGFRVTTRVSLPGRFLVLLPFDRKVGVSRKIYDPRKRRWLRKIVKSVMPKGFGAIIRTVAATADEKVIVHDLKSLLETWQEVEQTIKTEDSPSLVYKDLSTTSSVIRDVFNRDVSKIVVDSKKMFKQLKNYLNVVQPEVASRIELFKGSQPIFDVFRIESQLKIAMSRKVSLPSGGHIVIDTTEAMTVVDVNSGKYAASMNQEMNSLKTDLEASREICRQIRLRDIGGIIVIDFIDLEDEKNKKKVYDELRKEFRKDKAKATILPMTEFGLVQITRQRMKRSMFQATREKCFACDGTGYYISKTNLVESIDRWLKRFRAGKIYSTVTLKVSAFLYRELTKGIIPKRWKYFFKFGVMVEILEDVNLKADEFRFISTKTEKDITLEFL
ncbi:MAG: Rne/Rng family ribonuclease [Ignavibacteria bacterium]|nr:Rne/Rng family ribonuclease [Ignavibacteria bacterium]